MQSIQVLAIRTIIKSFITFSFEFLLLICDLKTEKLIYKLLCIACNLIFFLRNKLVSILKVHTVLSPEHPEILTLPAELIMHIHTI